ncbi:MAG: DNA-3-methyladenine glycosylase 2 family protein, partial [Bdellovibrio sp.]|nr:DNA-3-methyladenine glycosylase 2 family protein [Bdellovibrio sp.]
RPPFDFAGLMKIYESHRVGNLEWFHNEKMHRLVFLNGKTGVVAISNNIENSCLDVEIDFPDTSGVHHIISKVRNLFDLDSDPLVIANALESNKEVKKLLANYPGIRLPSGWDPFEIAVSAILGQLVSVEFGRSLVHDLIEIAGEKSGFKRDGKDIKLFPTPDRIIKADLSKLKTTNIRKQTLKEFSKALIENRISLEPTQDVSEFIKSALEIRGIGPWTANYIALRALRSTDTFPGSDLILARALERHSKEVVDSFSPWRGYAAALFWRSYAQTLKKTRKKKA